MRPAVDVVLKAGDLAHHPYIIHGSNPNQTDAKRPGLPYVSLLLMSNNRSYITR